MESGGPLVMRQSIRRSRSSRRVAASTPGIQLTTWLSGTTTRVSRRGAVVSIVGVPGAAFAGRRSTRRSVCAFARSHVRTTSAPAAPGSSPWTVLVMIVTSWPIARRWRAIAAQRAPPTAVEGG